MARAILYILCILFRGFPPQGAIALGRAQAKGVGLGVTEANPLQTTPMTPYPAQGYYRYRPNPPSLAMTWPVIQRACSLCRNCTNLAASSGIPQRPEGNIRATSA